MSPRHHQVSNEVTPNPTISNPTLWNSVIPNPNPPKLTKWCTNVRYNHKIPVAYSRSSHQSHKLTQTLSWEVYANVKETCHAFYILPWDVKRVALKWSGFHDSMRE